jgi:hypothetical protein
MLTDSATWRRIREDFKGLPKDDWILCCSSDRNQSQGQWVWIQPQDASLCARADAIFLKAAKARGYDTKDQWVDELRDTDFVSSTRKKLPDGTFRSDLVGFGTGARKEMLMDGTAQLSESADKTWFLQNVIEHSITLCDQLEAEATARATNSLSDANRNGTTAPKPIRKPGRPVILVDNQKIKELRGERTQPVFARACRISVDALQRAEVRGRSSMPTIRKIASKAKREGHPIKTTDLIKNQP